MTLLELYELAEENNIEVCDVRLRTMKAFAVPGTIAIDTEQCETSAEEKVCLGHEMGHEMRDAFYCVKSKYETLERQEERAKRWSVDKLVPAHELKKALENVSTEIYELAEYFNVTEDFIRDAFRIYRVRGLIA